MALLNVSFDAVSEVHLQDLVSTGVPEGVFLEYKRTTYGNGDADVKEYLKGRVVVREHSWRRLSHRHRREGRAR
jgi:hypothetical protein